MNCEDCWRNSFAATTESGQVLRQRSTDLALSPRRPYSSPSGFLPDSRLIPAKKRLSLLEHMPELVALGLQVFLVVGIAVAL